jgi:hypothetical protein
MLRAFKHTVKRSILCPKKVEVTGGWVKLHNEEIQILSLLIELLFLSWLDSP